MNILLHTEKEATSKLSLDELFEKKHKQDLQQLAVFNKILNRIHKRITVTSKNTKNKHIWFVIPSYLVGEPVYSNPDCIAYVISKLKDNGFYIKYIHPNTIFVSWENYVPMYVRTLFKKKTGLNVDERGVVTDNNDENEEEKGNTNRKENIDSTLFNERGGGVSLNNVKEQKQFTPIHQYKPVGNLIYNFDLLKKMNNKINDNHDGGEGEG